MFYPSPRTVTHHRHQCRYSVIAVLRQSPSGDSHHCDSRAQQRNQRSTLLIEHEAKTTTFSSFIEFSSNKLKVSSVLSELCGVPGQH